MTDTHDVVEPEYPSPSIVDSRRLLGPNLYSARTGAVIEVTLADGDAHRLTTAWRHHIAQLVNALDWGACEAHVRPERGGASLFVAAPLDVLMTATEVNEQAWVAAESAESTDLTPVVARLGLAAEAERNTRPNLESAYAAARSRGLVTTFDDEIVTVGVGAGSRSWSFADLPTTDAIPWDEIHDAPLALVTGSNGKTTTTRLIAAMCRAQGQATGWSCSDGVWVDDAQLEGGDYSGPSGARAVLRDPRVQAAVLETARGGILRRGLAVTRADVAIITNISADHFGEYGIDTLRELADVKGVVARVVADRGCLVLNADDPLLVDLASRVIGRVAWFSAAGGAAVDAHRASGGDAAFLDGGRAVLQLGGGSHDLGAVHDMPVTLRGSAPHNVQNLLGAALVAGSMGVSVDAIRTTLTSFGGNPADNPGRLQVYELGSVTLLTDYAHNPGGLAALCETARSFPATRRLLLLGQAGNRDDEQLRELVRAAWNVTPFDHVVVKEMPTMLRGRIAGEVPGVFTDELSRLGATDDRVEVVVGELTALRRAFAWAKAGDLLVCPIHVEKAAVFAWLGQLRENQWTPGQPLPD